MSKNISVGIDIGTHKIKVVVSELGQGKENFPTVIGVGQAESKGLRHGYINNITEATNSLKQAVAEAEKASGVKIENAYFGIGGVGLGSIMSHGSVAITRADMEISKLDIRDAINASEKNIPEAQILNKKIIYSIPLAYKIDGHVSMGNPEGMKGMKLEVRVLFITCLEHHFNDLLRVAEKADIDVLDITASPIAASFVTLSKAQKTAGCVLANIGSETVSIVVLEENIPISLEVFPFGSSDITNDIALGLKIPLEEAEEMKIQSATNYPKKKLEEIIVARLSDIFELIDNHLKKIGKNAMLPAGIILTGGGTGVATIEDLARAYLKLPAKTTGPLENARTNSKVQIKDASLSVAYGLCVFGFLNKTDSSISMDLGPKIRRTFDNTFKKWFRQFMP